MVPEELFSVVESLTKHQKKALLAVLNHKVVFANWAWEVTDISVAGMEECHMYKLPRCNVILFSA